MGDLLEKRITSSRPFLTVGIDYDGPFMIKISRNKTDKAYLCIFVCFTTRAVHLELVRFKYIRVYKSVAKVYSSPGQMCDYLFR